MTDFLSQANTVQQKIANLLFRLQKARACACRDRKDFEYYPGDEACLFVNQLEPSVRLLLVQAGDAAALLPDGLKSNGLPAGYADTAQQKFQALAKQFGKTEDQVAASCLAAAQALVSLAESLVNRIEGVMGGSVNVFGKQLFYSDLADK